MKLALTCTLDFCVLRPRTLQPKRFHKTVIAILTVLFAGIAHQAEAAPLTWDPTGASGGTDGSGGWSSTSNTWWNGSSVTAAGATDTVTFGTGAALAASYTATLTTNVDVSNLYFNYTTGGNYTISGGSGGHTLTLGGSTGSNAAIIGVADNGSSSINAPTISAGIVNSGGLTIADTNTGTYGSEVTLSGNNTGLTGTVIVGGNSLVSSGTGGAILLNVGNANALSSASSVTIEQGSGLRLSSSAYINNLILEGGNGQPSTSTPRGQLNLFLQGGTLTGAITLAGNTSARLDVSNFTIGSTIQESGGSHSITYNDNVGTNSTATLVLTGNSTYTGGTIFNDYSSTSTFLVDSNSDANFGAAPSSPTTNITFTGTSTTDAATLRADASYTLNANRNISASTLSSLTFDTSGGAGSNDLTVAGQISGSVPIVKAGSGTLTLSGSNIYTGNTTVTGGALLVTGNAGSSTGTLTVNAGTTLGGTGTITSAKFAIGGTGSAATVIVGNGTDTTSHLSLSAASASTITNATLEFNISSVTAHQGNQLNVGSTGIAFSGTTLALNIPDAQIITPGTTYVLIAGNSSTQYSGFSTFTNSQGQTEITAGGGLNFDFTQSEAGIYYQANSYLIESGGDIDVVVVPEPSAYALILGGLGFLLVWQRRRNQS